MKDLFKGYKNKGEQEYFTAKRRVVTLRTLVFFFISFSLYLAGYINTGSNKNLLTFVAVLGLLPASKSLIEAVMYHRYKGCDKDLHDDVCDLADLFVRGYGFVFTSYEKNYEVPVVICSDDYVYGLLSTGSFKKEKDKDINSYKDSAIKHLSERLKADGLGPKVYLFTDKDAFIKRLKELKDKDILKSTADESALNVLKQISL